MRSVKHNRKSLGFVTALVLTFAVLTGTVGRAAAPDLWVYEDDGGERWLVGCVTQDVADRIVGENGFQLGPGPSFILCVVDYVPVHMKLGR